MNVFLFSTEEEALSACELVVYNETPLNKEKINAEILTYRENVPYTTPIRDSRGWAVVADALTTQFIAQEIFTHIPFNSSEVF